MAQDIIDREAAQAWVEAHTEEGTFDVLEFVSSAIVPTDTVVVYRDAEAGRELNLLLEEEAAEAAAIAEIEKDVQSLDDADIYIDPEVLEEREERMAELRAALEATALTFTLKGLAPAAQKALEKSMRAKFPYQEGAENPEYNESFNNEAIARSITFVTAANGAVDNKPWNVKRLASLEENIYPSEFMKLLVGAYNVNFSSSLFDNATSADFS